MDITHLTVKQLSEKIKVGELTSVQITKTYLKAIEEDASHKLPLNAYTVVFKDDALKWAEQADKKIAEGKGGLLTGIPIAIKDNINIKGYQTGCSSHILEGYKATYNATVTDILVNREGMIPLGKTNLDEFAMGSSTETSYYGITRNPHDRERIPGGSSGGSAAAVAGFLAPVALGSDTGGSIRQPASCCGVVGMKPTYGTVSRYGLVAFASSLDQIGPIARNVEDASLLLEKLIEHEPRDSTSLELGKQNYILKGDPKGFKVGIPKEYFVDGMDPEVEKAVRSTVERLKDAGAEIVDISLPHTEYAVPTYYIVATAEASANLERYDGVKYGFRAEADRLSVMYNQTRSRGFGDEVKRRIMLGTYVLSAGYYDAYYLKALKVRTLIKQDFEKAFQQADVIVAPTSPTPAFKIGEKTDDPISMYLSDIFTISVNLAGIPAISVPVAKNSEGLPIGVQVMGNLLREQSVLDVAYAIEKMSE